MPHEVFSPPWIDAWAARIHASEEYRRAAKRWVWPILFVLRSDALGAGAAERSVYVDLRHGACREARIGTPGDRARAGFVLSAGLATWREVLEGRLDPVAGVMRGALRLEKGAVMTLAMHTGAARALVSTAADVDTHFPEPG
jgi:putative sterol carrier protein